MSIHDKVTANNAWTNGGSPTRGFLSRVDTGPVKGAQPCRDQGL